MNGTIIYREIGNAPELLTKWLEDRNQIFYVVDDKGVERIYVENDTPRDYEITPMIIEATTAFSLFTNDGERIGTWRSLDRAIKAQESAKVTISAEVDIEEDEDEPAVETQVEDVVEDL